MTAGPYYQEFRAAREELLKSKGAQHLLFNLRYPLQALTNWQNVDQDFLADEQPLLIDAKAAREIVIPALQFWYRVNPYAPAEATGDGTEFDSLPSYKMDMADTLAFHKAINADSKFALLWGSALSHDDDWDDGMTRGPAVQRDGKLAWQA